MPPRSSKRSHEEAADYESDDGFVAADDADTTQGPKSKKVKAATKKAVSAKKGAKDVEDGDKVWEVRCVALP